MSTSVGRPNYISKYITLLIHATAQQTDGLQHTNRTTLTAISQPHIC